MSQNETVLQFIIPTGSLEEPVRCCLSTGGYATGKRDRTGFCGVSNGVAFYQFDRRMVPMLFGGLSPRFDAGITGRDLYLASGRSGLREVASLCFSRSGSGPTRWVLAQRKGFTPSGCFETRIGCELPLLAEKLLKGVTLPYPTYEIERIEGSEEACVMYGVVDAVLVVTETGESLRACDLEIVKGCECLLESTPVILARNSLGPGKEEALQALRLAMEAAAGAKAYVTVTCDIPFNVDVSKLSLPSAVSPTVTKLLDEAWNACEICIRRNELGSVLLKLRANGAKAILVREAQGYLA